MSRSYPDNQCSRGVLRCQGINFWRVLFASWLVICGFDTVAGSAYKCVDTDGRVYFSDRVCGSDQQQSELKIRPNPGARGADLENLVDRQARLQRMLDAAAADRAEKARDKVKERQAADNLRRAQCEEERARLNRLDSRHCTREQGCTIYGLTKKDEAGNTVFASEREKQAEIRRLKASIAKNC